MSRTPVDILNLFVEFPGDMLFFLLVIACSQGSLFLAFGHRSRFPLEHSTRRYVAATAALVIVWLVMLGAAAVALYADLDANQFMPPLERFAYALTLLLLGWAFLSADFIAWRSRSNLIIFGAAFVFTLLFINTARFWLVDYANGLSFNASAYAPLWSALAGCIAAAALLLTALNTRQIVDAPLKALFFFLFVAGSAWDLLQIAQGDVTGNYQGGARLAYAGGLILLPLIIHRLAISLLENSLVEVVLAASQQAAAVPAEAPRPAASSPRDGLSLPGASQESPGLLQAIGVMLDSGARVDAPMQVVKAVLAALRADVCVLLRLPNDNSAEVSAGWDSTANKPLAGIALDLSQQPTLLAAAKRGDAITLLPDHHGDELQDLFKRLGVNGQSSMTVQPVLARAELQGLLLAGCPNAGRDLSPADLALLRDIAVVAGYILANHSDEEAPPPPPSAPQSSGDRRADDDPAGPQPAQLLEIRRELGAGLRDAGERISRLRLQIDGLGGQLADEQTRLLDRLLQGGRDSRARADLQAAFCESARLLAACDVSARELLDAEAALRLLDGSDAPKQAAQEYMHKLYNLLLDSRDRLRRQISALMVLRQSAPDDACAAALQQLQDDAAQLELQRAQQERRRNAITKRLKSLGAVAGSAGMLPALLQSAALRTAFGRLLLDSQAQLDAAVAERQALLDAGAGDRQELEAQLRQLSADHDDLLDSREAMRRDEQTLRSQIELAENEKVALLSAQNDLEEALADQQDRQAESQRRLEAMTVERDNLLTIRDQLTAKVAEIVDDQAAADERASFERELEQLRATVARLSQQREDLALDLSDARMDLAQSPGSASLPDGRSPLLTSLLQDLSAPIDSVRDYIDLLLAESIGILGAAQLQVLRMAARDVAGIAALLAHLQQADMLSGDSDMGQDALDVANLIEEATADAASRFADKGLLLELNLDDKLPALQADGAGIQHVLTQLLTNACEASPPGGSVMVSAGVGRALLRNAAEPIEALQLRVRDAGGGIASANLPRVFMRSYRAEYPSIPGLGDSGVGITVARAIARAHSGDLWATSEPGKGATFHLALPLPSAHAAEV